MEEIDIIELLQRVKEGKAPKEIEIGGRKYRCSIIDEIYDYIRVGSDDRYFDLVDDYNIFELKDTKIKILDKPRLITNPEIEPLNVFKLIEAPYMAKLLKEERYDEFMEHLKQSEVEIANKIIELIDKSNKK